MDVFRPERRDPGKGGGRGKGQDGSRESEAENCCVGKERRKGERGSQKGSAIRSVLGLHIYMVEGVHRWALN